MTARIGEGLEAVVDVLPEGRGAIGLLSSDEFTSDVVPFDEALLEAAGSRVAILLCADPENATKQARLARAHYERLGGEAIVLDVLERKDAMAPPAMPEHDVLFIGGGSP